MYNKYKVEIVMVIPKASSFSKQYGWKLFEEIEENDEKTWKLKASGFSKTERQAFRESRKVYKKLISKW